jgi:hypothetical protein
MCLIFLRNHCYFRREYTLNNTSRVFYYLLVQGMSCSVIVVCFVCVCVWLVGDCICIFHVCLSAVAGLIAFFMYRQTMQPLLHGCSTETDTNYRVP